MGYKRPVVRMDVYEYTPEDLRDCDPKPVFKIKDLTMKQKAVIDKIRYSSDTQTGSSSTELSVTDMQLEACRFSIKGWSNIYDHDDPLSLTEDERKKFEVEYSNENIDKLGIAVLVDIGTYLLKEARVSEKEKKNLEKVE